MNPLKDLFNKVFESTPAEGAHPPKEDNAFEWNPDEETVAPTSARASTWRRGDAPAEEAPRRTVGEASHQEMAASGQSLPAPEFERQKAPPTPAAEPQTLRASAPLAVVETPAALSVTSPPQIPASDFEDVYQKAGIKSPIHGYGVERVYRLLTSRRLVGLDRNVRRSALLTALDAAGVPASDVSQDAVLRRKALEAYEAEKALELQSLRSRNESRAEALQDTVETFTRQKQSQIERLAQGSTAAVRAQSDLEIRKRMEQDRLFRSLAYFVEPLPAVGQMKPARTEAARVIERFEATDMTPEAREEPAEIGASTRPISQSGIELALRAAAEDAAKNSSEAKKADSES